jgi:hypothetical protein
MHSLSRPFGEANSLLSSNSQNSGLRHLVLRQTDLICKKTKIRVYQFFLKDSTNENKQLKRFPINIQSVLDLSY